MNCVLNGKNHQKMNFKLYFQALFQSMILFLILSMMMFMPTWSLNYWEAWIYIGILMMIMNILLIYLVKTDPELLKRRFNNAQLSNLYFFRDSNKNEVDCIMEDIELNAVEIKSAKSFSNSYVDGLKSFARFSEMKAGNGNVVYGGDKNFTFKDFKIISWRNLERLHK